MWGGKGRTIYRHSNPSSCHQCNYQNTPPSFPSKTPPVPLTLQFLYSSYLARTLMLPEASLLYLHMPEPVVGMRTHLRTRQTSSLL